MTRLAWNEEPRILTLGGCGSVVREAGGRSIDSSPWMLQHAVEDFDRFEPHGVIFTGGGDIAPDLYGAKNEHRSCYGISEIRDHTESVIMSMAAKRGIPMLGICRGAQLLNVRHGGTLWQHLPEMPGYTPHGGNWHDVTPVDGTVIHGAFRGQVDDVMSIHHQAVAKLAPGFRVSAVGVDGTVEAIESVAGPWMLGVQFHPEMMADESMPARRIFEAFLTAAIDYAGDLPPLQTHWDPLRKPSTTTTTTTAGGGRCDGSAWDDDDDWEWGEWVRNHPVGDEDSAPYEVRGAGAEVYSIVPRNDSTGEPGDVKVRWSCFTCSTYYPTRDELEDHREFFHDDQARWE